MSRNPNSYNQQEKRRIKENKQKKADAGIIGKMSEDPLYVTFISMHERCENPKHINYPNYGKRGIKVCEQWCRKGGFLNFKKWANENGWFDGLTIDRIDNDEGYCPENCRWVTRMQQCYNRRCTIKYPYGDVQIPLGMIAKLEGVDYGLLYSRVRQKGMQVNEALADIRKSGS